MDEAIIANAKFLKQIVANPEIFGHNLEDCSDEDSGLPEHGDQAHDSGASHSHGILMRTPLSFVSEFKLMQITPIRIRIHMETIATLILRQLVSPTRQLGSINLQRAIWIN